MPGAKGPRNLREDRPEAGAHPRAARDDSGSAGWEIGLTIEPPILPQNPWQLPVLLNRSSSDGMAMRGADFRLDNGGESPGF